MMDPTGNNKAETMGWPPEPQEILDGIEQELIPKLMSFGPFTAGMSKLVSRIESAIEDVRKDGAGKLKGLVPFHNELCVALDLLSPEDGVEGCHLEYEPQVIHSEKRLDFRWTDKDGLVSWIEVKTIKPDPIDHTVQLEEHKAQGRFPPNFNLVYGGDLGGQLYHSEYTARSRMLEYVLETEDRIRSLGIDPDVDAVSLAICGSGFDWTSGDLENFAHYYFLGSHSVFDEFQKMEKHLIAQHDISFDRSICRIIFVERPSSSLLPTDRKCWTRQSMTRRLTVTNNGDD